MAPDFEVNNSPHNFDHSKSVEWFETAKKKFNPDLWNYTQGADSLAKFEEFMKGDILVFLYNRKDNSTYSKSPFYRTTCNVLFDKKEKAKCITVDMDSCPEIPEYFGLHAEQTMTIYFKDGAPIPVNMDQVKQSRNPIGEWIQRADYKIKRVVRIENEDDIEVFEEEAPIVFLVLEEGKEDLGKVFAGLSVNYPEMVFAWLVRSEKTEEFEDQINAQYRLIKSARSRILQTLRVGKLELNDR